MKRALILAGISAAGLLIATGTATRRASATSDDRGAAAVELGRRLFLDPVIGRAGRVSCAACHDPEHGFSDARVQSVDETGPLPRHSQPLTDLAGRGFHWDGEFDTVREIVEARVLPRGAVALNGIERAVRRAEDAQAAGAAWDSDRLRERSNPALAPQYYGDARAQPVAVTTPQDESLVDARLAWTGLYAKGFAAAFGDPAPTLDGVVRAVDAYVRSLRTTTNAFDRFVAGDETALAPAARRGRDLFVGKAGCAQCHATTPRNGVAALTDGAFHDTGIGWNAKASDFADRGAGVPELKRARDGAFKTPSLRDVARRAPYMHDGRFATLEQVVRYYDAGGTPHDGLDAKVKPLRLEDREVADLVAFLESLTGKERAGLGDVSPDRPKTLRVRVTDSSRVPQRGVAVEIRPAGDRLRGLRTAAKTVVLVTGADGLVSTPWPMTTHVEISCRNRDAVSAGLVPDFVDALDFVVVGAERPVYSLPTGICEDAAKLQAFAVDAGARESFTLSRVARLANGRTLYAPNVAADAVRGRYQLKNAAGSDGVGTYDLANWLWSGDPADLRPTFAAPPTGMRLGENVVSRLAKLLPRQSR